MPENALQAAFIAAWRGGTRLLENFVFPGTLIGTPLPAPPENPDPVIIIHGVTDSERGSQDMANSLRRDGFTVFTPTMPFSGMDGVEKNAEFLRTYIQEVLRKTGKKKVDMIGHSQGGVTIMAYIRLAGGIDVVDSAISIGAPHHGVGAPLTGLIDAFKALPLLRKIIPRGLAELHQDAPIIKQLLAGDETPGPVRYTSIYSKDVDGIVIPWDSPRLEGANNVVLDAETWNWGWGTFAGPHHLDMNHYSPLTYDAVRQALLAPAALLSAPHRAGRRRRRTSAR